MANEKNRGRTKTGDRRSRTVLSIINRIIGAGIFALPGIIGVQQARLAIFSYIVCAVMPGGTAAAIPKLGAVLQAVALMLCGCCFWQFARLYY
ncbi:MAG: hypothetical protein R2765_10710 [Ferruginibacter sp.]